MSLPQDAQQKKSSHRERLARVIDLLIAVYNSAAAIDRHLFTRPPQNAISGNLQDPVSQTPPSLPPVDCSLERLEEWTGNLKQLVEKIEADL